VILVDTSVWINHLRFGAPGLEKLLMDDQVAIHPFVIGELACGGLRNRDEVLGLLERLPQVQTAEHLEVMALVTRRRLHGRGIGWLDAHLLAAALLSGARLWTLDRPLGRVAVSLGIAHH
jgi:predicted nucleic acid-binding protein